MKEQLITPSLSQGEVISNGNSDTRISGNISSNSTIEIPLDKRGRISWLRLSQDPQKLRLSVEFLARSFLEDGVLLTQHSLGMAGKSGFTSGVNRFYPGGMIGLKANLGLENSKKPMGHWTTERLKSEAEEFYRDKGQISAKVLKEFGRADLAAAILKRYPGGLTQLKNDLSIPHQKRRADWSEAKIEDECRVFYQSEGILSQKALIEKGRSDLAYAASNWFPGGLTELKKKIGLGRPSLKPDGYWKSTEAIEDEAKRFYEAEGGLSHRLLILRRQSSLAIAVVKHYPGGMYTLKEKLGIDYRPKRPDGFWTIEAVEREAIEFFKSSGLLSTPTLLLQGRADLLNAIWAYPGRMKGLKEKLGISEANQELPISPDQANEQLAKLVGVAK